MYMNLHEMLCNFGFVEWGKKNSIPSNSVYCVLFGNAEMKKLFAEFDIEFCGVRCEE